jgi:hypothetical protein
VRDLVRLSPGTLEPVGLALREPVGSWLGRIAPDHRRVVLTKSSGGGARAVAALRVVDLRRMRAGPPIDLGAGDVRDAAWLSATGLVALVQADPAQAPSCCDEQLVTVDVTGGATSAAQPVPSGGSFLQDQPYRDGFVVLTAPPSGGIGAAQVIIASASGPARIVSLDRILAGFQQPPDEQSTGTDQLPGLAVDAADGFAYVVGADGLVARIDLVSGAVEYQQPVVATSLWHRLDGWLQPAASAKGETGSVRTAQWLGGGRLLVSGYDEEARVNADGSQSDRLTPLGASVVDVTSWHEAPLVPHVDSIAVDGDILVTYRALSGPGSGGLRAFAADGRALYTALASRGIVSVTPVGPRLVVFSGRYGVTERWVLDAATGRVLARRRAGNDTGVVAVG